MWTDGRHEVRHFFHLSYQEPAIALPVDVEYRVLSSRVVRRTDGKELGASPEGHPILIDRTVIEYHHLVQEV